MLLQLMCHFHFHAGATWDEGSFLDEGANDAESIVEGAVGLVEDELVGPSEQDRHGLALIGAFCDFDDFRAAAGANLFDETG